MPNGMLGNDATCGHMWVIKVVTVSVSFFFFASTTYILICALSLREEKLAADA
jgi:hypothetical protein